MLQLYIMLTELQMNYNMVNVIMWQQKHINLQSSMKPLLAACSFYDDEVCA